MQAKITTAHRGTRRWEKPHSPCIRRGPAAAQAARGAPSRRYGIGPAFQPAPVPPGANRARIPAIGGQNPGIGYKGSLSRQTRAIRRSGAFPRARILTGFSAKSTHGTRVGQRVCRRLGPNSLGFHGDWGQLQSSGDQGFTRAEISKVDFSTARVGQCVCALRVDQRPECSPGCGRTWRRRSRGTVAMKALAHIQTGAQVSNCLVRDTREGLMDGETHHTWPQAIPATYVRISKLPHFVVSRS